MKHTYVHNLQDLSKSIVALNDARNAARHQMLDECNKPKPYAGSIVEQAVEIEVLGGMIEWLTTIKEHVDEADTHAERLMVLADFIERLESRATSDLNSWSSSPATTIARQATTIAMVDLAQSLRRIGRDGDDVIEYGDLERANVARIERNVAEAKAEREAADEARRIEDAERLAKFGEPVSVQKVIGVLRKAGMTDYTRSSTITNMADSRRGDAVLVRTYSPDRTERVEAILTDAGLMHFRGENGGYVGHSIVVTGRAVA